jgi:hypothetical protein
MRRHTAPSKKQLLGLPELPGTSQAHVCTV